MRVGPMCSCCARVHRKPNGIVRFPYACDAFPQGVPEAILRGNVDHRNPYEGDGGLQFTQDPDRPRPAVFILLDRDRSGSRS